MKKLIYHISTLLLVVTLLSNSLAIAQTTPPQEPQQSTEGSQTAEASSDVQTQSAETQAPAAPTPESFWGKSRSAITSFLHTISFNIFKAKEAASNETAVTYSTEKERKDAEIRAQEELLKLFTLNPQIITSTENLIDLKIAAIGRLEYELDLSQRLSKVLQGSEQRSPEGSEQRKRIALLRSQTESIAELIASMTNTAKTDLSFLQDFKNRKVEVAVNHPQLFEMFRSRTYSNQVMLITLQRNRAEVQGRREILLSADPFQTKITTAEDYQREFKSLTESINQLYQKIQQHQQNPYLAQQLRSLLQDVAKLHKSVEQNIRNLNRVKTRLQTPEKRNRAFAQLQKELSTNLSRNLVDFYQAQNLFVFTLTAATKADQKHAEFMFKIRELLPKTGREYFRQIPDAFKQDKKAFLELPLVKKVLGLFSSNTPAKNVQNNEALKAQRIAKTETPASLPEGSKQAETPVSLPESTKQKDISWKFEGKNMWDALNSIWGQLRKAGYISYTQPDSNNPAESRIVNPIKVTLTTADLKDRPTEVREIDYRSLETIARQLYLQGQASEQSKDIILLLKESSLTKNSLSQVRSVKVTEVNSPENTKTHRIVDVEAMSGEKATLEYTLDAEIATKTASPMAMTSIRQNLGQSIKHAVYKFPVEAPPFYLGLLANTWLNFLTKYHMDPKAFERFFHELTSLEGQIGFAGFMVGNHFGSTLLREMMNIKNMEDMARKSLMTRMFITNMSMAMGSLFSNITHDLLTITKGCATARWNASLNDDMNYSDAMKPCQEAWDMTVNSEKIHQYIQMSLTVMAASIGAAGIQALGGLAAKGVNAVGTSEKLPATMRTAYKGMATSLQNFWKTNRAMNFSLVPQGVISRYAKWGMPVRLTPAGLVVTAGHLILFFQSDALANPYIHKIEESLLNSGAKLPISRDGLMRASNYLASTNYEKGNCDQDSYDNYAKTFNPHSVNDKLMTHNNVTWSTSCAPIAEQIKTFKHDSAKWRDVLIYKFNMGYFAWQEVFSEFDSQVQVLKEFYKQLAYYSYNTPNDPGTAAFFNPLLQDDPFYGIIPYIEPKQEGVIDQIVSSGGEKQPVPEIYKPIEIQMHPNEDEIKFAEGETSSKDVTNIQRIPMEDAKIKRLLLAAQLIDKHFGEIESYMKGKVFRNSGAFESYKKDLTEIKNKFLSYNQETRDFTPLLEGIRLLNIAYDKHRRVYLDEISEGAGTNKSMVRTTARSPIRNSMLSIYRFVGKPKPLKKGESFMVRFNDWAKVNFGSQEKLLQRNGLNNISEAMLWYAMCGADYSKGMNQADAARFVSLHVPLTDYSIELQKWKSGTGLDFVAPRMLDTAYGENPAGINCAALKQESWMKLNKSTPMSNMEAYNLKTNSNIGKMTFNANSPVRVTIPASLQNSATGGTVVSTNTVTQNSDDSGVPIIGTETVRQYDNMLEFLVDNINPEFGIKKGGHSNLHAWWDKTVTPLIDNTFLKLEDRYYDLIRKEFGSALYSNDTDLLNGRKVFRDGRKIFNNSIEPLVDGIMGRDTKISDDVRRQDNAKIYSDFSEFNYSHSKLMDRKLDRYGLHDLPNSLSLAFVDELDMYLTMLQKLFNQMSAKRLAQYQEAYSKETRAAQRQELSTYITMQSLDASKFTYHLQMIKKATVDMLHSLIVSVELTDKDSVTGGAVNSDDFSVANIFGPALAHYQEVLRALGLTVATEKGPESNFTRLYHILKLHKAGYSELENGLFLTTGTLQGDNVLLKEVQEYMSKDSDESLKAYQAYQNKIRDPNLRPDMTSEEMLKHILNTNPASAKSFWRFQLEDAKAKMDAGLKPRMGSNNSIYSPLQLVPGLANMSTEDVVTRSSVLRVDPAEKSQAEVAYLASTAVFETIASVYNQVTVFKAASSKSDFKEAGANQKVGNTGSAKVPGM